MPAKPLELDFETEPLEPDDFETVRNRTEPELPALNQKRRKQNWRNQKPNPTKLSNDVLCCYYDAPAFLMLGRAKEVS